VNAGPDSLAIALYVRTGDLLKGSPHPGPARPKAGITPRRSDAELITLAVPQAPPGLTTQAR
jgi:hypothetical protein